MPALPARARSSGFFSTKRNPSTRSDQMLLLCSTAGGGGSGVRMSLRQQAEKRNERASNKRAKGALINCTSGPATAGPLISASPSLIASLLLASTIDHWEM